MKWALLPAGLAFACDSANGDDLDLTILRRWVAEKSLVGAGVELGKVVRIRELDLKRRVLAFQAEFGDADDLGMGLMSHM